MEPPAKRLRILQSVEVDEDDPEYINAKRKQKERTKSRLETIFAKYENMHESMSDDIDMRTNTVVVDRGHLRRLNRQVDRKETILLDTLGIAAGDKHGSVSESEGGSQDSEDELAPTQPPKSKKRRLEDTVESEQPALPPPITPANATTQAVVPLPNPSNTAANLLNLVSFPQTPAGQQAQTTFITTLAQTINQAVQQAVAPLFSSFLPITPTVSLPLATALPVEDPIAPATDPKWYFPPLSVNNSKPRVVASSPISSLHNRRCAEKAVSEQIRGDLPSKGSCQMEEEDAELPTIPRSVENVDPLGTTPRRTSPLVEIRMRTKRASRKYIFTEEDDVYMSKRKILHKRTWQEIKNSKEKWKNWPLQTFQRHWNQQLKERKLHLTAMPTTSASKHDVVPQSPTQSHHLPTPSSLEHEDSCKEADHDLKEEIPDVFPSSSHFDDDELELLSLTGADSDHEQHPINEDEELFSRTPEDAILPSVETEEFVDEEMLQQGLLEESPPIEPSVLASTAIKIEPVECSKHVTKYRVISFQTEMESTDEDDLSPDCVPSTNPGRTHDNPLRKKSDSIDLVGNNDDDEMQAPTTPYIKREHSTPPPSALLIRTPALQTPKPSALGALLHSSGSKSTSKLNRRAYLKQVKQSWTKKATPGAKMVAKRRSFHAVPVKRGWEDDEDELA